MTAARSDEQALDVYRLTASRGQRAERALTQLRALLDSEPVWASVIRRAELERIMRGAGR